MTEDEYLNSKDDLLGRIEQQLNRAITPILERALATYDPATVDDEYLGDLNDALRAEIGVAMFTAQTEMSSLALRAFPGRPQRMQSPEELLRSVEYGSQKDPAPLSSWLDRQSPSRWMRDLIGGSAEKIRNSVNSLIEGAVWSFAARTEQITWSTPEAWRWVTRPELSQTGTCPVCAPLDGRVERRMEDFPVPYPVHPRCKCGVIPAVD